MAIVLDSSPLSMITNPRGQGENLQCRGWFEEALRDGTTIAVPEICWFEIRRELVRTGAARGLQRLDALCQSAAITYLPVTTRILLSASELWADARRRGQPTSSNHSLDIDVILAASALEFEQSSGESVTVATTNSKHLLQFVNATEWKNL